MWHGYQSMCDGSSDVLRAALQAGGPYLKEMCGQAFLRQSFSTLPPHRSRHREGCS